MRGGEKPCTCILCCSGGLNCAVLSLWSPAALTPSDWTCPRLVPVTGMVPQPQTTFAHMHTEMHRQQVYGKGR